VAATRRRASAERNGSVFKTFYDSALHHPGIAFIATGIFLLFLAPKLRFARSHFVVGFSVLFAIEILADALFTGAYSPVANTPWMQPVAITFVILGDYRYFVAVERAIRARSTKAIGGLGSPATWGIALAFAFIVPVLSVIPQKIFPESFTRMNAIFLVYEAMFFVLALVMLLVVLPRRLQGVDADLARWVKWLTLFELVQYGLWATADVLILSGVSEPGYLLRLVPNTLYYGGFLPFLYFSAPKPLRVGKVSST
jgi:hypothetical protein